MTKCCEDKHNDIESVNAWLRKDAPDESSRPDVPIDTNLPDPALLPEAPPLYRRLPRLCSWIFREPLAALVHAVAYACCLLAIFALLRPMLVKSCAFGYALRIVLTCVEINQCVGCTQKFFTKSFLGDDAAVLALSSGEEPASPRHRAGVASMAWRTNAP